MVLAFFFKQNQDAFTWLEGILNDQFQVVSNLFTLICLCLKSHVLIFIWETSCKIWLSNNLVFQGYVWNLIIRIWGCFRWCYDFSIITEHNFVTKPISESWLVIGYQTVQHFKVKRNNELVPIYVGNSHILSNWSVLILGVYFQFHTVRSAAIIRDNTLSNCSPLFGFHIPQVSVTCKHVKITHAQYFIPFELDCKLFHDHSTYVTH